MKYHWGDLWCVSMATNFKWMLTEAGQKESKCNNRKGEKSSLFFFGLKNNPHRTVSSLMKLDSFAQWADWWHHKFRLVTFIQIFIISDRETFIQIFIISKCLFNPKRRCSWHLLRIKTLSKEHNLEGLIGQGCIFQRLRGTPGHTQNRAFYQELRRQICLLLRSPNWFPEVLRLALSRNLFLKAICRSCYSHSRQYSLTSRQRLSAIKALLIKYTE